MAVPDRRRPDAFQPPLMHVFRTAFVEKDSRLPHAEWTARQEADGKSATSRRGAGEAELRRHFLDELAILANTVDLGSALDLTALPQVRRSILNFGFGDVSRLTSEAGGIDALAGDLREALLRHEPRLVAATLEVTKVEAGDEGDAPSTLRFEISAELRFDPIEVPVAFLAEVDVGAGKIRVDPGRVAR